MSDTLSDARENIHLWFHQRDNYVNYRTREAPTELKLKELCEAYLKTYKEKSDE